MIIMIIMIITLMIYRGLTGKVDNNNNNTDMKFYLDN